MQHDQKVPPKEAMVFGHRAFVLGRCGNYETVYYFILIFSNHTLMRLLCLYFPFNSLVRSRASNFDDKFSPSYTTLNTQFLFAPRKHSLLSSSTHGLCPDLCDPLIFHSGQTYQRPQGHSHISILELKQQCPLALDCSTQRQARVEENTKLNIFPTLNKLQFKLRWTSQNSFHI